jgi:hypothetical protein
VGNASSSLFTPQGRSRPRLHPCGEKLLYPNLLMEEFFARNRASLPSLIGPALCFAVFLVARIIIITMNTPFFGYIYIYSLCISSPRLSLVRGSPSRTARLKFDLHIVPPPPQPTTHAKKNKTKKHSSDTTKKPNRSLSTPHPPTPHTHHGIRHRCLHALPHCRLIHPPPSSAPS